MREVGPDYHRTWMVLFGREQDSETWICIPYVLCGTEPQGGGERVTSGSPRPHREGKEEKQLLQLCAGQFGQIIVSF